MSTFFHIHADPDGCEAIDALNGERAATAPTVPLLLKELTDMAGGAVSVELEGNWLRVAPSGRLSPISQPAILSRTSEPPPQRFLFGRKTPRVSEHNTEKEPVSVMDEDDRRQLEEELAQARAAAAALEQEKTQAQAELDAQRVRLEEEAARLAAAQAEAEERDAQGRAERESLARELAAAKEKNNHLDEQARAASVEHERAIEHMKAELASQMDASHAALAQAEAELAHLHDQTSRLEGELAAARAAAENERAATSAELERSRTQLTMLEEEIADKSREAARLREDQERAAHELDELRTIMGQVEADQSKDQALLAQLRADMEFREAEAARVSAQRDKRLRTLESERDDLRRALDEAQAERQAFEADTRLAQAERAVELSHLETELEDYRDAQAIARRGVDAAAAYHAQIIPLTHAAPSFLDEEDGEVIEAQIIPQRVWRKRMLVFAGVVILTVGITASWWMTSASNQTPQASPSIVSSHSSESPSGVDASRLASVIDTSTPLLQPARELLASSEGKVADDTVRQALADAIDRLQSLIDQAASTNGADAGALAGEIDAAVSILTAASQQVSAAVAAFRQPDVHVSPQPNVQQADPAHTRQKETPPAPAQSPAPATSQPVRVSEEPAGYVADIQAGASSSGSSVTFTATVKTAGETHVTVVVSVGGKTVSLGSSIVNGTRIFSGTLTLPPGAHEWTVTADGLSASGSITTY